MTPLEELRDRHEYFSERGEGWVELGYLIDLTEATIDLRRETSKGLDGKPANALARIEQALTNLGYCPRHGLPLVCSVCSTQSNAEVAQ